MMVLRLLVARMCRRMATHGLAFGEYMVAIAEKLEGPDETKEWRGVGA